MAMEQEKILANHLTAPGTEAVLFPHCLYWDWGYSRAVEEMLQGSLQSYQHVPIEEAESGEEEEVDSGVAEAVKQHPRVAVWSGWHLERELGLHCWP